MKDDKNGFWDTEEELQGTDDSSEPTLRKLLNCIPQQTQSQESLKQQVLYLVFAGNRLGLYDAVDFLTDRTR